MNKTGGMSGQSVVIAVVILLVVGVAGYGFWTINQDKEVTTSVITTGGAPAGGVTGGSGALGLASCPSDQNTDGKVRYQDTLADGNVYDADPTVYFVGASGQTRKTAGALSASAFSTAVSLSCAESGNYVRPIAVATKDDMHSVDYGQDVLVENDEIELTLRGKAFDVLKVKVEDNIAGGSTFFNNTDDSTQGYSAFGSAKLSFDDAGAGTSLTLGSGEAIDTRIYLKTNNTKKQFGEDGLRTFMVVDAGKAQFDAPIVARDGGDTLTSVKTTMSEPDRDFYADFEYVYEVGSFGDRQSFIDFYMETKVDVTSSHNPTIEFCSETRYNSNDLEDTVLIGCASDATTQAVNSQTNRQQMEFVLA